MKLRTFLLCLAAAIALTLCASAADVVDSGTCGDNLTWTLDGDGVLTISGNGAMENWSYFDSPWYERSNIVTVIINDGVTSIGSFAFRACKNLTSVTIPHSVTSIENQAFLFCESLMNITIPNSVTSIGYGAFSDCENLISVTIPENITRISGWMFNACKNLTSVMIPENVVSINDCAFYYCEKLTSVTIPKSVTSIGQSAFSGCVSLTDIIIPDRVVFIGHGAFSDCENLTSVTIPDSVTFIGDHAFFYCLNLTSVTIPDSVASINNWAFNNCSRLTSVAIPYGVTFIGQGAFADCKSLTDIYYDGSATQWSEIHIINDSNDALKSATIHYNAKDVGVGITLTDESGKIVDANGQTGETTKKDAFQDGAEFTASFAAVDPDAVTSGGLVTANIFLIFYDSDGLMVSLEAREIDLSDPFNLMFVLELRIPEGAKTLKFLMLGDNLEPLRAQRLIEKSG